MSHSIVVLVKPVADPSGMRIDHETNTPVLSDQLVMSSFDEYAVEEALRIKEANGGLIVAMTVGPNSSRDVLIRALAMGVDEAVHLVVEQTAAMDILAIAELIAEQIQRRSADIVLAGQQSDDFSSGSVGPAVAEMLGWPQITSVTKVRLEEGKIVAVRDTEYGRQHVEAPLPVVLTAMTGLNEPRMPSLRGMIAAKKKPYEVVVPDYLPISNRVTWDELYVREMESTVEIIENVDSDEAARKLVDWLLENKLA